MKHKKLIERLGAEKIQDILDNAHQDAVYYVDEWNEHFKVHGYCTDKCIIGVHNPQTHYRLETLKRLIADGQNRST